LCEIESEDFSRIFKTDQAAFFWASRLNSNSPPPHRPASRSPFNSQRYSNGCPTISLERMRAGHVACQFECSGLPASLSSLDDYAKAGLHSGRDACPRSAHGVGPERTYARTCDPPPSEETRVLG